MLKKPLFAALGLATCLTALADNYPNKPITLVVGFPPGGGADSVARVVSEKLGNILGQPIVIDNRPGAGTTIASDNVARANPDGYTLLLTTMSLYGSDQLLYKSARYDAEKNFTHISRLAESPMLLAVTKDLPEQSVKGLIERAKQNPGKLSYSSSGTGVVTHLAGAAFEQNAGINMLHIPYKGGAPSIQAVAAGDVDITFGTPPSVLPLAQAGKLRLLAVTTADRSNLFPDLPGMKEAGLDGYNFTISYNLYGPANLPEPVLTKLFEPTTQALNDPDVKSKLEKQGNVAAPSQSPVQFKQWALEEGQRYLKITEAAATAAGTH